MNKSIHKLLYRSMVLICAIFIVWTVLHNFVFDPNAVSFLSHKTHLNHPLDVHSWLNVLHIHIAFACLALISGAINFATRIWRNNRKLHRGNGYAYLLCVFVVCGTSGYMAPTATGGTIDSIAFNLMNMLWMATTATAFIQIKRKRVTSHRMWMVRSYVFCFTNLWIHVLMFVYSFLIGIAYNLSYTMSVYGSIVLNAVISSIVIRLFLTNSGHTNEIHLSQAQ
jgi:hypothetical protein